MDQVTVSRELLRQVLDALEFFASEMTVGQRYTAHGQTAIDAPGEIHKLLEQPPSGADWWRLKLPGGRNTDDFESARVGDYNRGWNDYRKAAQAALSTLEQPAVEPIQPQWRKKGTGPWWDGLPDQSDGGGPYETRTLFTAPQAQQQPQLLTDAEIRDCADECDEGQEPTEYTLAFGRAVEQKALKKRGLIK